MAEGRFFVVGSDGKQYGPVDPITLRKWVSEGRVNPQTDLIEEATGASCKASSIEGLFGVGPNSTAPPVMGAPSYEAPQPAKRGGMPGWAIVLIILTVFGVCGVSILAAILFPVFQQARRSAQATVALSNLKQLGLAGIMYAGDYDDRLPLSMESAHAAKSALFPYTKNASVFETKNPKGGEILGNKKLNGFKMSKILSPADVPMFYDSMMWPNNRGLVVYTDGHAKRLDFGLLQSQKDRDPKVSYPTGTSFVPATRSMP